MEKSNCAFITSYERDNESELDFAQARMYSNKLGRFTTTDPLLSSGRIENSQTWNRYAYVLNNPMVLIDPSGLYQCKATTTLCEAFSNALAEGYEALNKYDPKSKEYKKLKRALDSYGCNSMDKACGAKGLNGVTVGVSKLGQVGGNTGTAGVVGRRTKANPTGQDIRVTFDKDSLSDKSENGIQFLVGAVAHEGSHVADGSEWVQSGFLDSKSPTLYQGEKDAFTVTSYLQQQQESSTGTRYYYDKEKDYYVWDSSWKNVDKERLRSINGIIREAYGVTSSAQGGRPLRIGAVFPK